jgi:hypothetical protein
VAGCRGPGGGRLDSERMPQPSHTLGAAVNLHIRLVLYYYPNAGRQKGAYKIVLGERHSVILTDRRNSVTACAGA